MPAKRSASSAFRDLKLVLGCIASTSSREPVIDWVFETLVFATHS